MVSRVCAGTRSTKKSHFLMPTSHPLFSGLPPPGSDFQPSRTPAVWAISSMRTTGAAARVSSSGHRSVTREDVLARISPISSTSSTHFMRPRCGIRSSIRTSAIVAIGGFSHRTRLIFAVLIMNISPASSTIIESFSSIFNGLLIGSRISSDSPGSASGGRGWSEFQVLDGRRSTPDDSRNGWARQARMKTERTDDRDRTPP